MSYPQSLSMRLLARAVENIGGVPRAGQIDMVAAVDQAISSESHAVIQAGTGTGKSLGYLSPVVAHLAQNKDHCAVIATATLALQSQLASKDIPTIVRAARDLEQDEITWTVLKGGSNYVCLAKIRDAPIDPLDNDQYSLEDLIDGDDEVDASSLLGRQVVALRRWAEEESSEGGVADRDGAPRHSPKAWAQVSIPSRECPDQVCPYFSECFVHAARDLARHSQLVVTNHALVAVEATHGWPTLKSGLLILDEAHELAGRVTTSMTDELSPHMVDRVVRMVSAYITEDSVSECRRSAEHFATAMDMAEPGRITEGSVLDSVGVLRATLRTVSTALGRQAGDARRERVAHTVKEVLAICERVADTTDHDVAWVSERPHFGSQIVVAPLRVADAIRDSILARQPSVLTSATLALGNSFDSLLRTVGLSGSDGVATIDVGSPFDYRSQGICYIAKHLPAPGRDQAGNEVLGEIADLMSAANGHALGLFSSMRAAERAAEHVRRVLDLEVLLQGEENLSDLISQFLEVPTRSLFGTLSLWQGVDAPGEACHLVIIDRIPFPRPDDPLAQARQEDVSRRGGNGFMEIAASHAGLMLAQGSGRLIRSSTDRGVVAILDSRLLTARYGKYLINSMPGLWMTTDRSVVVDALRRLASQSATSSTHSS